MDPQVGFLYAVAGMITLGLSNALVRILAQKISPLQIVLYREIIAVIFLLVIMLCFSRSIIIPIEYFLLGLAISSLGFIGQLFLTKALKTE